MQDLLELFNQIANDYSMHLEIGYNKTCDWFITVYKKGCGDKGGDLYIVSVQEVDMKLCFAKAHVMLKEWLMENYGGY